MEVEVCVGELGEGERFFLLGFPVRRWFGGLGGRVVGGVFHGDLVSIGWYRVGFEVLRAVKNLAEVGGA